MDPAPVRVLPGSPDADAWHEGALRVALGALDDGVLLVRGAVVADANDALLRMLDLPRGEVVGRPLDALMSGDAAKGIEVAVAAAAAGRAPERLGVTLVGRGGARVPVDATLAPVPHEAAFVLLARPAPPRAPDVMASVPGYIFTVGRDGTVLSLNRAAPGLAVEEVVGRPQLAHVAPEDRARVAAVQARVFETGEPATYEVRADVGGQRRWFENHAAPLVQDGRVTALGVLSLDVTERKEAQAQAERAAERVEKLLETSQRLASELDTERIVQATTDAARVLTGAAFGAFFYNVEDPSGRGYMLYTLSGAPREAFETFPMPRATALFGPTFRGEGTLRLDDVLASPQYGESPPYHGMPPGHLPVRSYLAVPVVSRSGKVHGGLFFGHPEPARFTAEAQALAEGLAAQAAIALDNAALYRSSRDSETRFRVLAETMPQMVWYTDADGRLEWVNRRWTDYTGQAEPDVREHGWVEAVHPDDREATVRAWRASTQTVQPYEVLYRLRRHDGAYRWHLARATPMRGESGEVARWFGTSTDVHEQQVGAERLRQSEERYRFLAENLGDVIARSTMEGVFLDVTPAARVVFGRAPEEMVGMRIVDAVDPADHGLVRATRERIARGETEYVVQLRVARKDGTRAWVEVHGRAVRDASGKAIEIISSVRDVTARVEAEAALRESEERFRLLSASSPVGIFLADGEGRAAYVNPACERICGFGPGEADGDGWTRFIHPEDRERVQREWQAYQQRHQGGYRSTFRWVHRDGTARWSHVRATPLVGPDGRLTGHVGTVEDITALKEAAQELERTRAELVHSEKMSALGSLVAGVAHELRTPLTYLGTNLDLVERAVERVLQEMPPERADALRNRLTPRIADAREGMDRINRLVEDLRRFTRLREGGERQPLDLAPLVDEAVGLFRATRRGDVQVVDELRPTPLRLLDRVQVQQVVLNLLENAREAGPRDGVVRVRTRADEAGRPVLEVEDHGPGIPPEVQARMWDPFFTTKRDGSGLGLSIVKRIADQHGATLACESVAGKGTTFRLTF